MVMGPSCGLVLADLGAEVIKVEPLEGDNTRRLQAAGAGFFPVFNRNKKSLAVNLKDEKGKAIVQKLLDGADVMTENFRPGALEKLGFEVRTGTHPFLSVEAIYVDDPDGNEVELVAWTG